MFVRRGLEFESLTVRAENSYLAGVRIEVAGEQMLFVSIHIGPPKYRKNLRAMVDALYPHIEGRRFVVGGDLNAARYVDAVYGGKWYGRFFEELAKRQLVGCHWLKHGKEGHSFWGHQAKNKYQCDHLFTDAITAKALTDCSITDDESVRAFSDHGPISVILKI